jgi:predicted DsbA family dithiol-disulfide isomerase/uncharacterized membrane protein
MGALFGVLRLALVLAMAASAALTVDYLSANPSFCGATSGCGVVRRSGWGYVGPAPVPLLGLLAFASVLSLSLGSAALRRMANWAAVAGALIAAALLVVQGVVIGAYCAFCTLVDAFAMLSGVSAGLLLVLGSRAERRHLATDPAVVAGGLRTWAWGALGALAIAAPLVWPALRPAGDLPAGVRERHVPGKINVVEFVDFECPFCRMFHPTLKKVVDEYGARVNFVRLDMPLESHPHARGAAKAHLCAGAQRAGDRMAEALFETEALDEPGLVAAAKSLGLDVKRFEECLASPKTEAELREVENILRDSGMLQGLPTTFVGSAMLVGAHDDVALRDAFERAARGADDDGIPGWAYAGVIVALAGGVAFFGRRRE